MTSYLEVIDDTFPVKVVVGDREEVPVESFTPGVLLLRRFFTIDIFDGEESSDLAVNGCLAKHNEEDHVSMAQQEQSCRKSLREITCKGQGRTEEAANHDKCR